MNQSTRWVPLWVADSLGAVRGPNPTRVACCYSRCATGPNVLSRYGVGRTAGNEWANKWATPSPSTAREGGRNGQV